MQNIVTIDGPSGVGKSTISRKIAVQLGYTYLDTGAMYRATGLFLVENKVDESNDLAVQSCLDKIHLTLLPAVSEDTDVSVLLGERDISKEIRSPEMAMIASRVSALPLVRSKLTAMQREIGEKGKIVAEGRDTGTVVFPDAAHKFFLDAAPEERAKRRIIQLRSQGKEVDEQQLLEMIIKRDKDDSERAIAPLKQADDAHYIDTTRLSITEVIAELVKYIG